MNIYLLGAARPSVSGCPFCSFFPPISTELLRNSDEDSSGCTRSYLKTGTVYIFNVEGEGWQYEKGE